MGYGLKADTIVGYTYLAENYMPHDLIEYMIDIGAASPAARDMPVETVLDQIAEANAIDRHDEYSFDSSDFPKVIFAIMLDDDDYAENGGWYEN